MHSLDYYIKTLYLTDLETRRNRGDLIQTYKILNGLEKVSDECKLNLAPSSKVIGPASRARGNSQKLQRQKFPAAYKNNFGNAVGARHNFFSNRVVPLWNVLTDDVVRAPTLTVSRQDWTVSCLNPG